MSKQFHNVHPSELSLLNKTNHFQNIKCRHSWWWNFPRYVYKIIEGRWSWTRRRRRRQHYPSERHPRRRRKVTRKQQTFTLLDKLRCGKRRLTFILVSHQVLLLQCSKLYCSVLFQQCENLDLLLQAHSQWKTFVYSLCLTRHALLHEVDRLE